MKYVGLYQLTDVWLDRKCSDDPRPSTVLHRTR